MAINLNHDQEARITALAAARGRSLNDAVQEALGEWEERQATLLDIRATLDAAEADIAAGRGSIITAETQGAFVDRMKQRGRERAALRAQSRLV